MVSIIIPVYNVEKYIDTCLESVVNQTYKDIEILVMEAKSTDGSLQKILEWAKDDDRFTVVSRKDGGLGPGRNYALQLAKGEYVLFLDSDDWLEHDYVEKMVKLAEADEEIDIVFSEYIAHYEQTGKILRIHNRWAEGVYEGIENKKRMMRYANNSMWGKLYRPQLFIKNQVIQPALPFEDLAVYPQLIVSARKIAFCNQAYLHYRAQREGSLFGVKDSYLKFPKVMKWSEDGLKSTGEYETYQRTFDSTMFHHYRKLCGPYINIYEKALVQATFPEEWKYLDKHFKELQEYRKLTYWGLGSFTVRWIIHRLEDGKEGLRQHFAFSGVIAQMTNGMEIAHRNLENPNRQRWLKDDCQGMLGKMLREGSEFPDVMVIDFVQECQDVYKTSDGNYLTNTELLKAAEISTDQYLRISWQDESFMKIWQEKCMSFIELLRERMQNRTIVLVETYYTRSFWNGEKEDYFAEDYTAQNRILKKMYQYFKENFPEAQVYQIPEEFYYTDVADMGYKSSPVYLNWQAYGFVAEQIDTKRL